MTASHPERCPRSHSVIPGYSTCRLVRGPRESLDMTPLCALSMDTRFERERAIRSTSRPAPRDKGASSTAILGLSVPDLRRHTMLVSRIASAPGATAS